MQNWAQGQNARHQRPVATKPSQLLSSPVLGPFIRNRTGETIPPFGAVRVHDVNVGTGKGGDPATPLNVFKFGQTQRRRHYYTLFNGETEIPNNGTGYCQRGPFYVVRRGHSLTHSTVGISLYMRPMYLSFDFADTYHPTPFIVLDDNPLSEQFPDTDLALVAPSQLNPITFAGSKTTNQTVDADPFDINLESYLRSQDRFCFPLTTNNLYLRKDYDANFNRYAVHATVNLQWTISNIGTMAVADQHDITLQILDGFEGTDGGSAHGGGPNAEAVQSTPPFFNGSGSAATTTGRMSISANGSWDGNRLGFRLTGANETDLACVVESIYFTIHGTVSNQIDGYGTNWADCAAFGEDGDGASITW